MRDILHEIIENKKIECIYRKNISMSNAILNSKTGIISEFKRKSPSKGWIKESAQIKEIIPDYLTNGATALSILTDNKYFGGSLDDLKQASRISNDIPILRKDFIIKEEQIYEAKLYGSDAILLIASCINKQDCYNLAQTAHRAGLEVLLEVHNKSEINHINKYINMVGVNNRNLGTFNTDINNSFELANDLFKFKDDLVLISESGISNPETIIQLQAVGYKGFLIGETFMKDNNPGKALNNLISKIS